jgi:hypothetical protein
MNEYLVEAKLSQMERSISDLKKGVDAITQRVTSSDDLWDNSDLVRNWHISSRTLATWRKEGIISYVKAYGKIWYPREARESFLKDYMVERDLKLGGSGHGR